jgi:hypothetical protein
MKTAKIVFWVSTGLLSVMMLMSAGMYIFKHADIVQAFETLGFPTFVIYPLATFKLLGLVAVLTRKVDWLKEWAYAGFFFNFLLAFGAHFMIGDGEAGGAVVALVLLVVSYIAQKKAFI